jgi:hypothetical protein
MDIKELKHELRMNDFSGDGWGTVMHAFFDVAESMYARNIDIPTEWAFRPGLHASEGPEEDFYGFMETDASQLQKIGAFLYRVTNKLRYLGKDY